METLERLQATLAERYTILREIGKGGMATVYLARDVRHDRQVAVKVLDPELGAVLGAERFLAEIRVTANLQHPNLLPLFDSGAADGLLYYVMPFVDGETLRGRLDREKQLPVEQVVHLTVAIANALEYAHRNGVIHRDLKPENILLQAGEPIIADFGIALAVSKAGGARVTQTGLSLGTPQYMSPEQATGDRGIDGRTDIYSLAAMAYEMLTGEPPYTGTTSQAIIAKLMTEDVRPITVLRRNVTPHVDAAIRRGLEKLPADRFDNAHDFAVALTSSERTLLPPAAAESRRTTTDQGPARTARWPMAAMLLLTVASLGVAAWMALQKPAAHGVTRTPLYLPDELMPHRSTAFAISADGNLFAYSVSGPGGIGPQIVVKSRERAFPVVLPATAAGGVGTASLAFSPDGEWVAFVQSQKLKKATVSGGAGVIVADVVSSTRGLAWLDDESIVYVKEGTGELMRIAANSATPEIVWKSDTVVASVPNALPDSRGVLFAQLRPGAAVRDISLAVVNLENGQSRVLVPNALAGWYLKSGHLVYVRPDGTLLAVPFDLSTLAITGDAVPVMDSVALNERLPMIAIARDGSVAMRSGGSLAMNTPHTLVWMNRDGSTGDVDAAEIFRLTSYGSNRGWALSPDGRRVAIGINTDAGDDIWIKQLPRGPLSRLSFDANSELRPRWSPDGKYVTYSGQRSSGMGLLRRSSDGTGAEELIVNGAKGGIYEHQFSNDGKWLVLRRGGTINVVGSRDIQVQQMGKDAEPRDLIANPAFDESAFSLSPDNRWIVFESNETGTTEVYIRPFPGVDVGKWQVSNGGGRAPLWSRTGRELYYINANRAMVAVTMNSTATEPGVGEQQVLFTLGPDIYLTSQENYVPYDIGADGRFLMARRLETDVKEPVIPVVFIDNWFEELRRRLGNR